MTDRINLRNAFRALRKQGINARMSVKDCGNGCCVMDEKFDNSTGPYVYFTQHRGFEPHEDSFPDRGFYLQHGCIDEDSIGKKEIHLTDEQANFIVDTLREHGIYAYWSGKHTQGIFVGPKVE